jgi:hypothetical protein
MIGLQSILCGIIIGDEVQYANISTFVTLFTSCPEFGVTRKPCRAMGYTGHTCQLAEQTRKGNAKYVLRRECLLWFINLLGVQRLDTSRIHVARRLHTIPEVAKVGVIQIPDTISSEFTRGTV